MQDNRTSPAPSPDAVTREQPRPRQADGVEPRRVPPPTLHTEEEAKLAAEIEKLRD